MYRIVRQEPLVPTTCTFIIISLKSRAWSLIRGASISSWRGQPESGGGYFELSDEFQHITDDSDEEDEPAGAPKEYTKQSAVAVSARLWLPCGSLMSALRMIRVPALCESQNANI